MCNLISPSSHHPLPHALHNFTNKMQTNTTNCYPFLSLSPHHIPSMQPGYTIVLLSSSSGATHINYTKHHNSFHIYCNAICFVQVQVWFGYKHKRELQIYNDDVIVLSGGETAFHNFQQMYLIRAPIYQTVCTHKHTPIPKGTTLTSSLHGSVHSCRHIHSIWFRWWMQHVFCNTFQLLLAWLFARVKSSNKLLKWKVN